MIENQKTDMNFFILLLVFLYVGFLNKAKDIGKKSLEKGADISKKGLEKGIEIAKHDTEAPDVKDLPAGEEILFHTDFKVKTGLVSSEKHFLVITDKNLFDVLGDTNEIIRKHDLSKITVDVKNRHVKSRGSSGNNNWIGMDNHKSWEEGEVHVYNDGKEVIHMSRKKNPDDIANDIQRYVDRNSSDTSSEEKVSIPANENSNSDDPLTMLKKRLVNGEISKEEFEEMKKLIE